jgi:alkanesulfonate monooxygenase
MNAPLRFHCTMPASETLPDIRFARAAEEAGFDSVVLPFSAAGPDPIMLACALGRVTTTLKTIITYPAGPMQPASFVQQINSLSTIMAGRLAINIVADSLADERYARTEEFLDVCQAFWSDSAVTFNGRFYQVENGQLFTPFMNGGRTSPHIYVAGESAAAERLASAKGSVWLRPMDTPKKLAPLVATMRARGVETCLEIDGSPAIDELIAYRDIGVTQFIVSEEIENFGREVIPRVRQMEERS